MEFLVSSVYGKADLHAFQHAIKVRGRTKHHMFFRWWGIIMGAWMLYAAVRAMITLLGGEEVEGSLLVAMIPILLLLFISAHLLVSGITDRSFISEMGAWNGFDFKGQTFTYRFGEKKFQEERGDQELSLAYSSIESLYEDKERFFLFIGRQGAHIIRKADFQQGEPDAFRAFIEKKTKLSVQKITSIFT